MPREFTVRLEDDQADELEAAAEADGAPATEVIRQAVAAYLRKRRRDAEFEKRAQRLLEENQSILDRLADS